MISDPPLCPSCGLAKTRVKSGRESDGRQRTRWRCLPCAREYYRKWRFGEIEVRVYARSPHEHHEIARRVALYTSFVQARGEREVEVFAALLARAAS